MISYPISNNNDSNLIPMILIKTGDSYFDYHCNRYCLSLPFDLITISVLSLVLIVGIMIVWDCKYMIMMTGRIKSCSVIAYHCWFCYCCCYYCFNILMV